MKQYLDLLRLVERTGVRQKNRTGVDTFMIPGGMMQFDLLNGFPILTTKAVNFDAVKAELIGFLRGCTSAADFRKLGTKIWDANANRNETWLRNPHRQGEDDLGPIYGKQWRAWNLGDGVALDQLGSAVSKIISSPQDRRIIVSAWNPADINRMALPPCHLLYQFIVSQEERKLNLCMYMRSCDMFLGVPFNISSYALLLSIIAMATGYAPGTLTMFLADCHIYENHLDQVREQLRREPKLKPRLVILAPDHLGEIKPAPTPMQWIEQLEPASIYLLDYNPLPAIKAEMAV